MAQESRKKIYRGLCSLFSTKAQGTGLGLPLVQRMVYAHGGTMHLSRVNPGLRVAITLPVSLESFGE